MTHAHITTWFIALVLFFVALNVNKKGNEKGFKILQMVLRVLYLLILATGLILLFSIAHISLLYILKAVVGLWIISLFELILMRTAKKQPASVLWFQFVVAFLLVLYLGLKLPLGFHLFQ
ncbi:YisL family protein [Bacillota bacterium Lsc_1132]